MACLFSSSSAVSTASSAPTFVAPAFLRLQMICEDRDGKTQHGVSTFRQNKTYGLVRDKVIQSYMYDANPAAAGW